MTVTKGVALSLTVLLAGALAGLAGSAAVPPAATSGAQLKAISARVGSKGVSLVIEATEPVPYVAVRPDPLTVVLEFRNVGTDGLANSIVPSARSPIASVAVEPTESMGARVSRVRIALAQPVAHHVRSERNTVVVDFDRLSDRPAPSVLPPVSRNTPDAMQALLAASVAPASILAQGAATSLPAVVAQTAGSSRQSPSPQAASASLMAALTPVGQATPSQGALGALSAQQPQPPAPATTAPQAPEQRRYSGRPVSMQFEGLDLRAVLRLFAEISGLNVVIDPTVQGSVDVALTEVPWDQALDIILRANKLGYVIDGTIVRIAPLNVLTDEQTLKRKLAEEQTLAGDLRVLTKSLSYAKAQDLMPLLTKSALSPRGTVQVDPRTNTLIITDLSDRIQASLDLIAALDKPQPQVEIEARIVQTTSTYARALGIQWGGAAASAASLGNTTNLAFPNSASLAGAVTGTSGPVTQGPNSVPTIVNLPAPGATSAIGLALGSVNGAFNLDAQLTALETKGKLRLLSTPRVSTQNNALAEIKQGVTIGYLIGGTANVPPSTQFVPALLDLKVTPQISNAGTVIMLIVLTNDSVGALSNSGIPSINNQSASTSVQVGDGETTVIGGIYASIENTSTNQTPGLSQIPVLKWLFRSDTVNDQKTELLIFIRPRIIKVQQG